MQETGIDALSKLLAAVESGFVTLDETQTRYLQTIEAHALAKHALERRIDAMYEEGLVVGKNEREREAVLRQLLPDEYRQVGDGETAMRIAERTFRSAQVNARRLELHVEITKMIHDVVVR